MKENYSSSTSEFKRKMIQNSLSITELENYLDIEDDSQFEQLILQKMIDLNTLKTTIKILGSDKKTNQSKINAVSQITDKQLLKKLIKEILPQNDIFYHINTTLTEDRLNNILTNIDDINILQKLGKYRYFNNKQKSRVIQVLIEKNIEWDLILELIRKLPSNDLQKLFLGYIPSIEILSEILKEEIDNPILVSESIELLNNTLEKREFISYLTSIVFSSKYRTTNRIACLRKLVKIMTNSELELLLKKLLENNRLSHMLYLDLISTLRKFELLEDFFFSTPLWSNKVNIIESNQYINFAPRIIFENLDHLFSTHALNLILHTKSYNDNLLFDIAMKSKYKLVVENAIRNIDSKKKLLELRLSLPSEFQPLLTAFLTDIYYK